MKKAAIWALFLGLILSSQVVLAQSRGDLPSAGITPASPFFFLDRWGERIQEFFAFNPENKAKLQVKLAGERIAEIKIMLRTKGVSPRGLEVAQSHIESHAKKAVALVEESKQKGNDVSRLAAEINDSLHAQREIAKETFTEVKNQLNSKKEELRREFVTAVQEGDLEAQKQAQEKLKNINNELQQAKDREQTTVKSLVDERRRLWSELSEEEQKNEQSQEAEESSVEAAITEAEEARSRADDEALIKIRESVTGFNPEKPIAACILLYAPVCGVDGKTYSNSCFAGLARVEVAYNGECKSVTPEPEPGLIQGPCPIAACAPAPEGCWYEKNDSKNERGCLVFPCGKLTCGPEPDLCPKVLAACVAPPEGCRQVPDDTRSAQGCKINLCGRTECGQIIEATQTRTLYPTY